MRPGKDPQEPEFASNRAKELYVNRILNSKYDRQFKPPLLRYFVDWLGDHPSWEPLIILPTAKPPDNYYAENLTVDGPHIVLCQISGCQCADSSQSLVCNGGATVRVQIQAQCSGKAGAFFLLWSQMERLNAFLLCLLNMVIACGSRSAEGKILMFLAS